MLPYWRVLEPRIHPQAGLPERENLYHAVSWLARRHLDAADREGVDLHGRSSAEELHLERERHGSVEAMGFALARGLARRPRPRRLRGQSVYRAGGACEKQRGPGGADG